MTFKSAFKRLTNIFRKEQPVSDVTGISTSPFVKAQYLSSNRLSNLHVLEMAKAYRLSNPEPNVCQVECGAADDRVSNAFSQSFEHG